MNKKPIKLPSFTNSNESQPIIISVRNNTDETRDIVVFDNLNCDSALHNSDIDIMSAISSVEYSTVLKMIAHYPVKCGVFFIQSLTKDEILEAVPIKYNMMDGYGSIYGGVIHYSGTYFHPSLKKNFDVQQTAVLSEKKNNIVGKFDDILLDFGASIVLTLKPKQFIQFCLFPSATYDIRKCKFVSKALPPHFSDYYKEEFVTLGIIKMGVVV